MKKRYRIVCEYPSDRWVVQDRENDRCEWMGVYHCAEKGEAGYDEARRWIAKQETEARQ